MSASALDRKSTRLNSSHTVISYAVFCLRSEEHTSELQSHSDLVCRLLLEKEKHTSELQSHSDLVCRLLLEIVLTYLIPLLELINFTPPHHHQSVTLGIFLRNSLERRTFIP